MSVIGQQLQQQQLQLLQLLLQLLLQQLQLDNQALLKAKYCPRVAATSHAQKNRKNHVTLTFDR